MPYSHTPTYNLKAVITETGIAADTLRAWERRYGLPLPERTPGGHRLYSEHDIETLKWLISKQSQGLSISRAVELWKEMTNSGKDPLVESQSPSTTPSTQVINLETARQAWVQACLAFDESAAEQVLNQAFATNSVELVCTDLIQRGIFEIGELWYQDKASVQQEHFASGLAMRHLDALMIAAPSPTRNETILAACPPEEQHIFPLLFLSLFLRRRGWNVINLGANVPLSRMEEAVENIRPSLVVLSAQQLTTAVTLRSMASFLGERGIQVAFGGRIFNQLTDLRKRIPAHFLGVTIDASVHSIEVLALRPTENPPEDPIQKSEKALADSFGKQRQLTESIVVENLQKQNVEMDHLTTANRFLGNTLSAALELGNPAFLNTDMDWLRNLLTPRDVPLSILPVYLEAYEQAIQKTLGQSAAPITQWLQLYRQIISGAMKT